MSPPARTLLAMASIGGFLAEDSHYYGGWMQAMERLSTPPRPMTTTWLAIKTYHGRLFLYALGLGAAEINTAIRILIQSFIVF